MAYDNKFDVGDTVYCWHWRESWNHKDGGYVKSGRLYYPGIVTGKRKLKGDGSKYYDHTNMPKKKVRRIYRIDIVDEMGRPIRSEYPDSSIMSRRTVLFEKIVFHLKA